MWNQRKINFSVHCSDVMKEHVMHYNIVAHLQTYWTTV